MSEASGEKRAAIMTETAASILASVSAFNSEGLRKFLTDDVTLELPFAPSELGPRKIDGLDNVVATMSRAPTVYSVIRFTVTDNYPIPAMDTLILRAKSEGTLIRGGIYSNDYLMLFAFCGDRVVKWIEYFDALIVKELFSKLTAG